ncbi:unnamed protein product [Eruca vesicaria subsp. sativa]|uniref:Peptidase A1 domain-containing protein n=1 Tax=Eruca vesicaria subsp. sativa TaxID=29727 RepID=A0ABC8M1T3_ERUVS|nr:unnamed protein product [Eruca vesicaria subsp. sativa]
MARLFICLNIFFILLATTTSLTEHNPKPKPRPKQKPHAFILPVFKDTKTGIYYTNVTVGKPSLVVNLAVDVRGSALWFQCEEIGYNSTTYTPILCGSKGCEQTKDQCSTCMGTYGPSCRNDTCHAYLQTQMTYNRVQASLVKDDVVLSYTSPSTKLTARLPLACMLASEVVAGLPYGTQGILGLGNSSTSFVTALVSSYKIPFKVALCLPSNPGNDSGTVYIGGGRLPPRGKDVRGLLVSTPLVSIPETREHGEDNYYIDVKSIEVNGKKLSFNQDLLTFNKTSHYGGTKISNIIPYTLLDSSIYKALVEAFAGKAKKRKAMYPFSDCFSYKSFGGKSLLGEETPVISLVLGGAAKWDIYGPNSLVKVRKTVLCLAFVDAGESPRIPIEIGGYQMEDNLVEFDLDGSKFSFTSSLLRHNTSCSQL